MATNVPDAAFQQLHLYVCMMIELRNYAITEKTQAIFELCKEMLINKVNDFPTARAVVNQYIKVVDLHNFPVELCDTNYTDKYVQEINDILENILHQESLEQMIKSFQQLNA